MADIKKQVAQKWLDPDFRAQEIAEAYADDVLALEDEDGS